MSIRRSAIAFVGGLFGVALVSGLGGRIQSEYIGSQWFSVLMPAIVGAACGSAAVWASRPLRGPLPRVMGAIFAVLSAAYSFQYSHTHYGPIGRWLPPLAAAGAASWLWTRPVDRRKRQERLAAKATKRAAELDRSAGRATVDDPGAPGGEPRT